MTHDLTKLTDVELVTRWLSERSASLLAECERRGHKRISKAFAAINAIA